MKHLLLTLLIGLPTFLFSQNYSELNAASAANVYYSTNKKYHVTEYLTTPDNRYVLFVNTDTTEQIIYFNSKSDIVGFLSSVNRSIDKQRDIIYKTVESDFTIINITKNLSRVRISDQIFSMDKKVTGEMLDKFSN